MKLSSASSSGWLSLILLSTFTTSGRNLKSIRRIHKIQTFKFYLSLLLPDSPFCQKAGDSCPVRRDFGNFAFPQGKELISHIDVLRRILLPSSRGNQTIWMVPFPAFGFPLDGFLLFLLYPFQNLLFSWKPWIPALPCQIVVYRRYPAVASFPSMPLHQSYSVDSPH